MHSIIYHLMKFLTIRRTHSNITQKNNVIDPATSKVNIALYLIFMTNDKTVII